MTYKKWLFNDIKTKNLNEFVSPDSPQGNNSISSLSVLFEDREYYYDYIIPFVDKKTNGLKTFGDLINENSLYGLIDNDFNAIYAKKSFMKDITSADSSTKYVLNFVADAFNDLNKYMLDAVLLGKIPRDSVFCNLKSYRAFIEPEKVFSTNKLIHIIDFLNLCLLDKEYSGKIKIGRAHV